MQKILNDPEPFVDEMLEGILAAHPDQLRRPSARAIVRADAPVAGKVGIATEADRATCRCSWATSGAG